ncbi:cation diffusion facilitator family transporter [Paenibacillus roseipurpureus]|uniref:Cation diffusion facilitator family transporter n=1 Tax=Paenibacillus roseopurpureus TaxID=2918901 RepID=A0AA96RLN2_9BACL|nr:cation diffusion facilitator family transporter [Paenibacillus sp. MBLB1832]WNR43372.1 cation diffusion facilitator family transporter [Paenibacillus sp. MBLB1832]
MHQHDSGKPHACEHEHGDANHDHAGHQHHHPTHAHSHAHAHSHDHHGHGHGHHGHHHHHGSAGNKQGLWIALGITAGIMLLEFAGGLWTSSLALLSDSGHMLSDAGSLALSLLAIWFAAKPTSSSLSFGFHRVEILAALFNALTLFLIAGLIIWEAIARFMHPTTVASGSMMVIASVGLLANLISAWSLMRKGDVHGNLNLRSAYLHILGDALGSVGAIIAGAVMLIFGWYIADPIISIVVSLLILKGAWSVLKSTLHILMEGAPGSVSMGNVKQALEDIAGVVNVHDLHVWTITSGMISLSCHLLIEDEGDSQGILQQAITLIEKQFGIAHATVQIEKSMNKHGELLV